MDELIAKLQALAGPNPPPASLAATCQAAATALAEQAGQLEHAQQLLRLTRAQRGTLLKMVGQLAELLADPAPTEEPPRADPLAVHPEVAEHKQTYADRAAEAAGWVRGSAKLRERLTTGEATVLRERLREHIGSAAQRARALARTQAARAKEK